MRVDGCGSKDYDIEKLKFNEDPEFIMSYLNSHNYDIDTCLEDSILDSDTGNVNELQ